MHKKQKPTSVKKQLAKLEFQLQSELLLQLSDEKEREIEVDASEYYTKPTKKRLPPEEKYE